MKTLKPYWFAEGLLDIEYKRYILLAYLQEVEIQYKHSKLFPSLQHLAMTMKSMLDFQAKCEELENQFPSEISSIDLNNKKIEYVPLFEDYSLLETVYEIINYSMPQVELKIEQGKEIYNSVEKLIEIEPVGVTPLYNDEGYFFLYSQIKNETDIFKYKMSFIDSGSQSRVLETNFLRKTKRSISNTFYAMKNSLIKEFSHLPNPATFLIKAELDFPKEETLLPIAKRIFMRRLAHNAH